MSDRSPSRGLGRGLLLVAGIILAHAGYSIYELQVVTREAGGHFSPLQTRATPEALLGLLLALAGISLTATPFKQISWESEMQKRTLSELSFKPGFLNLQESRAAGVAGEVPDSSTSESATTAGAAVQKEPATQ